MFDIQIIRCSYEIAILQLDIRFLIYYKNLRVPLKINYFVQILITVLC